MVFLPHISLKPCFLLSFLSGSQPRLLPRGACRFWLRLYLCTHGRRDMHKYEPSQMTSCLSTNVCHRLRINESHEDSALRLPFAVRGISGVHRRIVGDDPRRPLCAEQRSRAIRGGICAIPAVRFCVRGEHWYRCPNVCVESVRCTARG